MDMYSGNITPNFKNLQPKPSSIVTQRYRLERVLGAGVERIVYQAYDMLINKLVALAISPNNEADKWSSASLVTISQKLANANMPKETFSYIISWIIVDSIPEGMEDIQSHQGNEDIEEINEYFIFTTEIYHAIDINIADRHLMNIELVHNYAMAQQKLDWIHGDPNHGNILMRYCGYPRHYNICDKILTINTEYSFVFVDYSAWLTKNKSKQEKDANELLFTINSYIGEGLKNIITSPNTATWDEAICKMIK